MLKEVYKMHLEEQRSILNGIKINADKNYLTMHLNISDFDINEEKLFDYFSSYQGERYWFRSKDERYNIIGIGYIKSISKDKYRSAALSEEKAAVYNNIQHIELDTGLSSRISLFGGVKFDHSKKTDEWNAFNMVEFHLSKWQFVLTDGELFYTMENDGASLVETFEEVIRTLTDISESDAYAATPPGVNLTKDIFPDEWKALVDNAVATLDDKDFLKVVLSRQRLITFKEDISPQFLINRLNDEAGTYTIYYEKNDSIFVSKSPEKLFDIKDNALSTNAVAGSSPRTLNDSENETSRQFLMSDEKNRYEHELVRESIVEDLKPYSHFVKYNELPEIMENKYIYHLHTPITARLKDEVDVFQLVEAIHPTPAVGGMPKEAAAEFIIEHEFGTRGLYAAPVGIVQENNNSEFVVSLRSMLVHQKSASLFAGCGIVKGSNSTEEFLETSVKFTPMMNVLGVEGSES